MSRCALRRPPLRPMRNNAIQISMTEKVDSKLLEILVCPISKGPLGYDSEKQELISEAAGLAYPIRDGIPVMLPDEARHIED